MWHLQPMFVQPALLVAFFAILRFVPDRPVWLLAYQQEVPPRAVLVRLHRRQNVNPEIAVIQAELTLKTRDNHLLFRLSIVFTLQAVFGFIIFLVGNVRRKTILKEFLPFVALSTPIKCSTTLRALACFKLKSPLAFLSRLYLGSHSCR
ncbi:hypothetical protein PF006_g2953 [Phytophthora fragariae]|uniref:Uncharacterized protein n=1 Tax=Phytophthora fragariae TaxID=53985 RepID=A0A6A3FRU7_9STRA|nr:hypothetical protein PF009_g3225 [Phytophthora fragariae]KAE9152854.1 hypothetical protein PF006_g2953 [Phytophthora fragariae]